MSVTQSILLYGTELIAGALKKKIYRKPTVDIQRAGALRVACAYHTVSEPEIMVITGITPIELMAEERKQIYINKAIEGRENAKSSAQQNTMRIWQERWENEKRGRWTFKLIRDVNARVNRKGGEVNYYITQFLSSHGYFKEYLHKMGKVEKPDCMYGDSERDDAEHTFFHCTKWIEERKILEKVVGGLTTDSLVSEMLKNEANWNEVGLFVETILRKKKKDLDN